MKKKEKIAQFFSSRPTKPANGGIANKISEGNTVLKDKGKIFDTKNRR